MDISMFYLCFSDIYYVWTSVFHAKMQFLKIGRDSFLSFLPIKMDKNHIFSIALNLNCINLSSFDSFLTLRVSNMFSHLIFCSSHCIIMKINFNLSYYTLYDNTNDFNKICATSWLVYIMIIIISNAISVIVEIAKSLMQLWSLIAI